MHIYVDDEFNRWRHQPVNMAVHFLWHFNNFKCKLLHVDKMLVAQISIKIICIRKTDKIYMLILVSMDL